MKAYLAASVSAKNNYEKNYKLIVDTLTDLGVKVRADHILKTSIEDIYKQNINIKESRRYFHTAKRLISGSDILVAEISSPTFNVGYEIALAIEREKPVLALYASDSVPQFLTFVIGSTYEKMRVYKYTQNQLKNILSQALEELKEVEDVRFNFFVPPKIIQYLDWIAKKRKIPRSVYLRGMIEKDMNKDKEFKKENA